MQYQGRNFWLRHPAAGSPPLKKGGSPGKAIIFSNAIFGRKVMNKIQRVSLFFRVIFQVLFIAFPTVLAIAWMTTPDSVVMLGGLINARFIPESYIAPGTNHLGGIMHTLSGSEKLLGFAISCLPLIVNLFIIYSLIKLFKLYEKGEIFSINNVRYIRNTGYGLLATQLINPIYEGVIGLALTWHNPPGHRYASISMDQTNIGILFVGLMVILISWIMAEGCKLREEQQLTI